MELHAGDKDKVKALLKDKTPILILYHMEMCRHCQILRPTWEKVKRSLKPVDGIEVAEVEYSNIGCLPNNLQQIRMFPTIQIIANGKVKQEYNGDRSQKSIEEFAKSHAIVVPKEKKVAPKPPSKAKKPAVRKV
jgi:thioredoxin-like negative regulator of GroEL